MKKFTAFVIFLALAVIFIPGLRPSNADQVKVYEDQKLVKSVAFAINLDQYFVNGQFPGVKMDVAPFIQNDRTFVPIRFLGNALGVDNSHITWNDSTQTATLNMNGTLQMTVGKPQITSNGQVQAIDVAPALKNNRTFLPARYVAEGLGYQVDWDEANQIVVCWPKGQQKPDVTAVQQYVQQNRLGQQAQQPQQPVTQPGQQQPTQPSNQPNGSGKALLGLPATPAINGGGGPSDGPPILPSKQL